MEQTGYELLLWVSGAFISVLLAFIGYFLRKHVSATETLTLSVNVLNVTVMELKTNQDNYITANADKHRSLDITLDRITQVIAQHDQSITQLQTLMEMKRKKN